MADELKAAKEEGYKEGMAQVTVDTIEKHLQEHLADKVMEHIIEPKVVEALDDLTEAIFKKDKEHVYYHTIRHDWEPFKFMEKYYSRLRSKLQDDSVEEANDIMNVFVAEKSRAEFDEFISDPVRLKAIITKINEYQVNSTGGI